MRLLIATCAHRGDDARVVHRQARILLEAGHAVTLIAPAPATTAADPPGLSRVDIPRAVGRRRFRSWIACRRAVRSRLDTHDLLLIHDPELLPLLVPGARRPVVWDVHEDFVAAVSDRSWIPAGLASAARCSVGLVERWAARRCHVVLAEHAYQDRFPHAPVVPNSTWVPREPPTPWHSDRRPQLIYVGRLSPGRGVFEMIELGRHLCGEADVVFVGDADREVRPALTAADARGDVRWRGPLPNPEALALLSTAFAGLSLLRAEPNYVHSRPTKLIEYLAHGVPAITTPLPLAADLIRTSGGGKVVEYGDIAGCVDVIRSWMAMPERHAAAATAGHAYVLQHHNWASDGELFVDQLEKWSARPPRRRSD